MAPLPTPKLEDHPLSVVCDCLFNIFGATLHIGRSIHKVKTCHEGATGTHLHIYIHTHTHTCICVCVYIYIHTHTHIFIHTIRHHVTPLFYPFFSFTPFVDLHHLVIFSFSFSERPLAGCALGRQPIISDVTISWHVVFDLRLVEFVFTSATEA